MGFLPGGSSSITEISRSPYKLMASVRGMGVAVITKIWGGKAPPSLPCGLPLCHSLDRWATPNRCCSSTMARPRFLKLTLSSKTAWVPIRILRLPFSNWLCRRVRSARLVEPVKRAILTFIFHQEFLESIIVLLCQDFRWGH